ncbi:response regulator transcription factor [Harryflintia acetispora]|uniref:Stage 0 sporulation protein A homolog n=1 Tax=Harryflintia acetispora TaxID=1849041 RepID=A0A9X8Y912_9FIRM|nr:response regulator transcription factor [Harryflintia acetispora]RGB69942.1 DNA-binding response regulator [Harryflintia acetispora]TCL44729.1 two-component system alkaline phosphatase synthesis response regulator PhoP [Harryflintia acetispora]
MAKIFCVEDDESIRELILYALHSGGFESEGFESGRQLFSSLAKETPALILLDIMLPEEDGTEILGRLKATAKTSGIPVIMLTAKTSEYDKVKGLDAGADDYVTKPFGVMELLSRIRAVLRRCGGGREKVVSCREVTVDYERRTVTVGENGCELTYKEFELLYYMICNRGVVLSRDKIMDAVWGFDFEGESRTVDMHIKTLRQKLERAGAHDLIKTVRSVGYKIEG